MSETGATAREVMRAELIAAMEQHLGAEWSQQYEPRHFAGLVASYIESELWNKGYQIVPAGAVVLSAEEATDARACALARAKARSTEARGFRLLRNQQEAADGAEREAERYRALAAKLSGGAS